MCCGFVRFRRSSFFKRPLFDNKVGVILRNKTPIIGRTKWFNNIMANKFPSASQMTGREFVCSIYCDRCGYLTVTLGLVACVKAIHTTIEKVGDGDVSQGMKCFAGYYYNDKYWGFGGLHNVIGSLCIFGYGFYWNSLKYGLKIVKWSIFDLGWVTAGIILFSESDETESEDKY
eukprot:UN13595